MRWVVTGTNRGIGKEFVRQLVARGEQVDATVREAASVAEVAALDVDGRLHVHVCDVADDDAVRRLGAALGEQTIDVLINNAGIMGQMQSLEQLDLDDVRRTFDVDALGPIRVTRALLPALARSARPRVVSISSGMGSIGDNTSGGAYGYRMAKAALNMANRSMSVDLRRRGFVCVVINPGWVQTDMGGAGAPTPAAESVAKMLALVDALEPNDSGRFLDYRGGTYEY